MPHIALKNSIIVSVGQTSYWVKRGQALKTVYMQYFWKGNMAESHSWQAGAPYCGVPILLVEAEGRLVSAGIKYWETYVHNILQRITVTSSVKVKVQLGS